MLDETGDLLAAAAAGVDVRDRVASLHDLVAGALDERVAVARRPIFKSVGEGLQDVAVAELVWRGALEAGLATELPVSFETKR